MFADESAKVAASPAGEVASRLLDIAGLPFHRVEPIVHNALTEDVHTGDVTTDSLIDPDWRAKAFLVAKSDGVSAGLGVCALVFGVLDKRVRFAARLRDGERMTPGTVLAELEGPARSILTAERVALNFIQRLSGVATMTAAFVEAVKPFPAKIADTRKTTPGLRILERYAVRVGGGVNHRFNLSDGFMAKDNHLAALAQHERDLAHGLQGARRRVPHVTRLEVEVDRLDQIDAAIDAGAEVVLLDNMDADMLKKAVDIVAGRAVTEASGGITLAGVRAAAESGVDYISVGALTHSAPSVDISLDMRFRS